MNIVEKLAAEIQRVTALRARYQELQDLPQACAGPAIALMDHSLRNAQAAAGSGDIERIIAAIKDLEGFTE